MHSPLDHPPALPAEPAYEREELILAGVALLLIVAAGAALWASALFGWPA